MKSIAEILMTDQAAGKIEDSPVYIHPSRPAPDLPTTGPIYRQLADALAIYHAAQANLAYYQRQGEIHTNHGQTAEAAKSAKFAALYAARLNSAESRIKTLAAIVAGGMKKLQIYTWPDLARDQNERRWVAEAETPWAERVAGDWKEPDNFVSEYCETEAEAIEAVKAEVWARIPTAILLWGNEEFTNPNL